MKGKGNFVAISKLWTNIKPIDNEYTNVPSVYEQVKNAIRQSHNLGKPIISTPGHYFLLNRIASEKVR